MVVYLDMAFWLVKKVGRTLIVWKYLSIYVARVVFVRRNYDERKNSKHLGCNVY